MMEGMSSLIGAMSRTTIAIEIALVVVAVALFAGIVVVILRNRSPRTWQEDSPAAVDDQWSAAIVAPQMLGPHTAEPEGDASELIRPSFVAPRGESSGADDEQQAQFAAAWDDARSNSERVDGGIAADEPPPLDSPFAPATGAAFVAAAAGAPLTAPAESPAEELAASGPDAPGQAPAWSPFLPGISSDTDTPASHGTDAAGSELGAAESESGTPEPISVADGQASADAEGDDGAGAEVAAADLVEDAGTFGDAAEPETFGEAAEPQSFGDTQEQEPTPGTGPSPAIVDGPLGASSAADGDPGESDVPAPSGEAPDAETPEGGGVEASEATDAEATQATDAGTGEATDAGAGEAPEAGSVNVPAGWFPDPDGAADTLRYWDGQQWTEHFATRSPST
jgi:hypothetical protein